MPKFSHNFACKLAKPDHWHSKKQPAHTIPYYKARHKTSPIASAKICSSLHFYSIWGVTPFPLLFVGKTNSCRLVFLHQCLYCSLVTCPAISSLRVGAYVNPHPSATVILPSICILTFFQESSPAEVHCTHWRFD